MTRLITRLLLITILVYRLNPAYLNDKQSSR